MITPYHYECPHGGAKRAFALQKIEITRNVYNKCEEKEARWWLCFLILEKQNAGFIIPSNNFCEHPRPAQLLTLKATQDNADFYPMKRTKTQHNN